MNIKTTTQRFEIKKSNINHWIISIKFMEKRKNRMWNFFFFNFSHILKIPTFWVPHVLQYWKKLGVLFTRPSFIDLSKNFNQILHLSQIYVCCWTHFFFFFFFLKKKPKKIAAKIETRNNTVSLSASVHHLLVTYIKISFSDESSHS